MVGIFLVFVGLCSLVQGAFVPQHQFAGNVSRRSFDGSVNPTVQFFLDPSLDLYNGQLYLANFGSYDTVSTWSVDCEKKEVMFVCDNAPSSCFIRLWYHDGVNEVALSRPVYALAEFATNYILVGSFEEGSDSFHNPLDSVNVLHRFVNGVEGYSSCSETANCFHFNTPDSLFPPQTIYWSSEEEFVPHGIHEECSSNLLFKNTVGDLSNDFSDRSFVTPGCSHNYVVDSLDHTPLYYCSPPPPPPPPPSPPQGSVLIGNFGNDDNFGWLLVSDPEHYLLPFNQAPFTVEVWVRRLCCNNKEATFISMMQGQPPAFSNGIIIEITSSWRFRVYMRGQHVEQILDYQYQLPTDFEVWYHLAVTRTWPAGEVKMFVNGLEVAPAKISDACSVNCNIASGAKSLQFGAFGADHTFLGYMDELRIWDYARSEAEINADKLKYSVGDEAGLMRSYRFDEPDPSTFTDIVTGYTLLFDENGANKVTSASTIFVTME